MDIDFHYYMMRALAEKAGFKPADAQLIAYASQYVDDSTDAILPFTLNNLPSIWYGDVKIGEKTIDPVVTAHSNLTYVGGIRAEAQNGTYIPFHFLPAKAQSGDGTYDYITRPNGDIAKALIAKVVDELSHASGEERVRELIGLGIATHSYVDTWAHQNFSGRYSEDDNSVGDIRIWKNGKWEAQAKPTTSEVTNIMATAIGHARAGYNPDKAYLRWQYRNKREGLVERNNTEIFMTAAEAIFAVFKSASKGNGDWQSIRSNVEACLADHPSDISDDNYAQKMIPNYKKNFPEIAFSYDKNEWYDGALRGKYPSYEFNNDRKWLYFQVKASEQRKFVLSKVKKLPTLMSDDWVQRAGNEWSDISTNVKNLVGKNIPEWINRSPVGPVIDFISPVPKTLEEKGRWAQITVENQTQFIVAWTQVQQFASGRYWEGGEPRNILPFSKMTFGVCNADRGLSGVSGAMKLAPQVPGQACAVMIAFSHPAVDFPHALSYPLRKCEVSFGDNCEAAIDQLSGGDHNASKSMHLDGRNLQLTAFSKPGTDGHATVTIRQHVN